MGRKTSGGPPSGIRTTLLDETRPAGTGLERSCQAPTPSWISSGRPVGGVERLSAWLAGDAYDKHRHDTYAVGLTRSGVQLFDYRGAARASTPGQVVVLYPDEVHDGRAGTGDGFGYLILYVEPARLAEAIRALRGRSCPLPFVRDPVSTNAALSRAVGAAFRAPLEPLAADGIVVDVAAGLMAGDERATEPAISRRVDGPAVERARQFLDAERTRVVQSPELEAITGLTRYDLCRQFRIMFGTSPHRYLLRRRLELARDRIHDGRPLAEVACDAGFADQAHFTRVFKSRVGLTPARYRALTEARPPASEQAPATRPDGERRP